MSQIEVLKNKVLKSVSQVRQYDDQIHFETEDGEKYVMRHHQDCCESVSVEEIVGNLQDLVGKPILRAEERSNRENDKNGYGTETYTFYELATIKGSVTIRWYGSSNGYYSEDVSFDKVK